MARKLQPAPNILEGYDKNDPASLDKVERQIRESYKLAFFQMNRIQEPVIRIKNRFGRTPKVRLLETGNQAGKTSVGVAEDIAHALGFRPWLKRDDPDFKIS